MERLSSFELSKWFGKGVEVNPVECAKLGYYNSGVNEITCENCGVVLTCPE